MGAWFAPKLRKSFWTHPMELLGDDVESHFDSFGDGRSGGAR
jgi:hypothetical protein